jgi:hypothetical protein
MGQRSAAGVRRFVAFGVAFVVMAAVGAAAAQSPADIHQWASTASASTEYGSGAQWAAMSAAGEPDVAAYGDSQLAWVPKLKDGTTDWLDLRFDQAVIPTGIGIHESFSPGFVTKVEAYHTAKAAWITLWEGTDPTPTGALGIFSPPLKPTDIAVDRIRVTIDTSIPDYNEIDAVELVGTPAGDLTAPTDGVPAQSPSASANMGSPSAAPGSPSALTIPMRSGQPDIPIPDTAVMTQDDAAKTFADVTHELRRQAGLIDALGDRGDAIYASIDAAQADFARRYTEDLLQQLGQVGDTASISGLPPRVDTPWDEIGGGTYAWFGAWMLPAVLDLNVGLSRGSIQLPSKTETVSHDESGFRSSINLTNDTSYSYDGNRLAVTTTFSYTSTLTDLATGTVFGQPSGSNSVTIELTGCPDSTGLVIGRVKSVLVEGSTATGSSGSATFKSEMNLHIFVDDTATAIRQEMAITSDVAMRGAYSTTGMASDDWDASSGLTVNQTRSGMTESGRPNWVTDTTAAQTFGSANFRSVGDKAAATKLAYDALIAAYIMPMWMASGAIDSAEKYWRGGNCVEVKVLQGNGGEVEAGSETQVVAQPRHKIDQVDLAKPVVATFSGTAGAQPVGVAIPAPAQFTYTAGEDGDTGTVTLTSTSNRGIGTTSVFFKVPRRESPSPPPPTPTPEPTFEPAPPTGPPGTDPPGSQRIRGTIEWHTAHHGVQVSGSMDLSLLSTNDFDFQVQPGSTYQFDATVDYCGSGHIEGSLIPDFMANGPGLQAGRGTVLVNGGPGRNLVIWIALLGDSIQCDIPDTSQLMDGFPGCKFGGQVAATFEAESGNYVISCEGTADDPLGATATVTGTLSGDQ